MISEILNDKRVHIPASILENESFFNILVQFSSDTVPLNLSSYVFKKGAFNVIWFENADVELMKKLTQEAGVLAIDIAADATIRIPQIGDENNETG